MVGIVLGEGRRLDAPQSRKLRVHVARQTRKPRVQVAHSLVESCDDFQERFVRMETRASDANGRERIFNVPLSDCLVQFPVECLPQDQFTPTQPCELNWIRGTEVVDPRGSILPNAPLAQ